MNRKSPNGLLRQFGDKLDFAKNFVTKPKTVGAVAPTSARMAKIMASAVRPNSGLPVLELGPGTGVITKAILDTGIKPDQLVSIEFASSFLPGLRHRFPGVQFIHGDAFEMEQIAQSLQIEAFDCIISALPLLNFGVTQRIRYVNSGLNIIPAGRAMVQFSYSPRPPVPPRPKYFTVKHKATVFRNIPPAKIWHYQRP